MCAVAMITANEMIDGVWLAQMMLFAAGFAAAGILLIKD